MKGFICFALMVVAVMGRPEAPGGYSYNRPQPQVQQNQGFSAGGSSGGYSSAGGYSSNGNSGGYSSNGNSGGFNTGNSGGGQTIIQKHIYVHVPPPEDEQEQRQQLQFGGATPQKHYKIIFIKAPSAPSYSPQQQAAAIAQNSEKTLIYVLVKKPEDIQDFAAPDSPSPLTPSKPEVYFIKYKTQKEASTSGNSGGSVSQGYGAPAPSLPSQSYGSPAQSPPSQSYGSPAPQPPSSSYGAPSSSGNSGSGSGPY